jgi:hypothetical protein
MRPTDFCHLNETACTRTSCVPGSLRDFHRVDTPRSLGLRADDRGTGGFTAPMNALADRKLDTRCLLVASFPAPPLDERGGFERGRFLPTAPAPIEPLTSLSPLPLPRNVGDAFASPSALLRLVRSVIAFPREEAAEVAVTTTS